MLFDKIISMPLGKDAVLEKNVTSTLMLRITTIENVLTYTLFC